VVGLVVAVAPAVAEAVTPVSDGIEKNVFSQAAGLATVMLASLVNVTVRVPLAPTTSGVVRVCELPLEPVAKFQGTNEVALEQPVWAVDSALVVKPAAYVTFVGRLMAVMVTGTELVLVMVATTSPVPPGKSRFVAAGLATAVIEMLATVPDWASPLDPELRLTVQFVAANATAAVSTVPATTEAARTARGRRLRRSW
jgi:hypothetical protein